MRLRTFEAVIAGASFAALIAAPAVIAQPDIASVMRSTPEHRSAFTHDAPFGERSTLVQSLQPDRFSEPFSIVYPEQTRIKLALATPLVQRVSRTTPTPAIEAGYAASAQEQPSLWLMGGVILLLIGYQLRRKHRFLRPHRFGTL